MFYSYCILFFIYSLIGWLMEVLLTLYNEHKFVNRGFLLGPCCPIYGFGCIILYLLLKPYTNNVIVLFILTLFTCSVIEYITSYFMEKIFRLRWWDYSNLKYNLNGVLSIKYITPFLLNIVTISKLTIIITIILLSIFIIDITISLTIVFKLKFVSKKNTDATYDIKNAIKKFIKNDIYLYERIIESFPNLTKIAKKIRNKF